VQIEGIAKRVANKLNISEALAEEICKSEFKFVVDMVKEKKAINCIYLGKFHVNKKYNEDGSKRYTKNIPGVQEPDIQE